MASRSPGNLAPPVPARRSSSAGECDTAHLEPEPGAGWPGADARPGPRSARVLATGIDTLSPCWYAEPGSPLARAMRALATQQVGRAWLIPESVGGYRVGWFVHPGLVFAEGRSGETLCAAAELSDALRRLDSALEDLGVPIAGGARAGLRRLDVAVDIRIDSATEGLALLECVSAASLGSRKLVAYRAQGCVESVLINSRAGRTLARLYDKGVQSAAAPRGHWLRLEAQWRLPRGQRLDPSEVDPALLRERFARRFDPLGQAAGAFRLGGVEVLTERLSAALTSGQLAPSRARSLAGYLVMRSAGMPQGASRTAYELERECRRLGLSLALLQPGEQRQIDLVAVLAECLAAEVWR